MKLIALIIAFYCQSVAFAQTLFVCASHHSSCYIATTFATDFLYHKAIFSQPKPTHLENNSIQVMAEWNLFNTTTAVPLEAHQIALANMVLTLTDDEKQMIQTQYPEFANKVYTLSECAEGTNQDIVDNANFSIDDYRKLRKEIFVYEELISTRGWQCLKKI